ncbi:glycosyl hydrolase family 28 protein [Paraflavisolibacter sp. H34]|uniref:glycoside hydrolase family 28 protein n=1 Tax=Huijunlia imazamoxiresistens TaxID=3127457 RepID=UPI003016C499
MKHFLSTIVALCCTTALLAQQQEFPIEKYGAVGDGRTLNTVAVQKAIDAASKAGGGRVVVPKGSFVTGALELKSGVDLHLQEGAVILGSDKRADYEGVKHPALILAVKQQGVSITGNGIIDGRGRELMKDIFKRLQEGTLADKEWPKKRPGEGTRTNLLYLEECTGVQVRQVLLKDATSWVTHYERCRNIVIDGIRLESRAYWNNDGIDIVDCKNVRITNSSINSADDAICLKSVTPGECCDGVYVENCTLRSSANAFKLGTGSRGGFRNITVKNLRVYDTYRSAIALEAVDGGFLENIDIRQVTAKNTGNAIFIKSGHRNNDRVYSAIKNIVIKDVTVEVPAGKPDAGYEMEGPLLKYPPGTVPVNNKLVSVSPWNHSYPDSTAVLYQHNIFPSSISGLPGHPVKNVLLENITITYAGGAKKEVHYFPPDSLHLVTEAEKDYPEFSMFGELPAWGFYVRHAEGIRMKNIKLISKEADYRAALIADDVKGLQLHTVSIPRSTGLPVIILNKAAGAALEKIVLPVRPEIGIRQTPN